MIEINNLSIRHGEKTIISDLSLHVARGSKMVFKGQSGSGKTSILNALMGFQPLAQGNITIADRRVSASTIAWIRSQIAWVPQELAFDLPLARDLLLLPFRLKKNRHLMPDSVAINAVLYQMNLSQDILEQPLNSISGGEKQRICLAAALMQQKPIILLDEPTSALDKATRQKITRQFCSLPNTTVIAASHDDYWIEQSDMVVDLE